MSSMDNTYSNDYMHRISNLCYHISGEIHRVAVSGEGGVTAWYRKACLWTKIASYPGSLPAGEEPRYEAKPKLCGVVYHDTNMYPLRFDGSSLFWLVCYISHVNILYFSLSIFSLNALCMYWSTVNTPNDFIHRQIESMTSCKQKNLIWSCCEGWGRCSWRRKATSSGVSAQIFTHIGCPLLPLTNVV